MEGRDTRYRAGSEMGEVGRETLGLKDRRQQDFHSQLAFASCRQTQCPGSAQPTVPPGRSGLEDSKEKNRHRGQIPCKDSYAGGVSL